MNVPVIPLQGLVIFPGIPTSFEISKKSSIAAMKAASASGGLVFVSAVQEEKGGGPAAGNPKGLNLYTNGVVAKIKQALKLPEENYRVLVEGKYRAEATSYSKADDYMRADVLAKSVFLTDNGGVRGEALMRETIAAFEDFITLLPKLSNELLVAVQAINDPGLLADFIAANVLYRYTDKQEILSEIDPLVRLERLTALLEKEGQILRAKLDIHEKVKTQIDQNQREYYLKEQLKVIQNELGGGDGYTDAEEYQDRILMARLPADIEAKLIKEAGKLDKIPFGAAESTVIRNYLDTCLEIPFTVRTKDRNNIKAAKQILDADHDGLDKVKERILEFLSVKQLAPQIKGQILCLVGPPGVGKSSIASSVARALKRKFVRVSLGGVRDEADIRGHRKTYIGSMPGRVINALVEAKSMNPVILLDEVDKLTRDAHGDPASALLEVLDMDHNKTFRDHFIEIPVDLSDCMFLATANTLETIPRPLIDRMEIIEIASYTRNEKISIFHHHLLPRELKRHGLTKRSVVISDDAVVAMIDHYTKEAGVRNLEREAASLCRRVAKMIVETGKKRFQVTTDNLETFLGPQKFKEDPIERGRLIGIANGLAWTEVGGEILQVETASMPGSGKIELTGSLGDVMKESAQAAVTYIRTHCTGIGADPDFYKTKDLHIHFPEGAIPKDGPSAGITMATALVSELSQVPVRNDVAMTGEITLRGRVLPIGGLREKTMAAYKCGMKTVVIPYDNVLDLLEIDPVVKESLEIIPVKTMDEVLRIALDGSTGQSLTMRDEARTSGESEQSGFEKSAFPILDQPACIADSASLQPK